MNKFLIGLSTAALIAATPALAQDTKAPTTPTPGTESTAPAERTAPGTTDTRTERQPSAQDGATAGSHLANWRASKLIGATVVNAKNETVGDINDFVVSQDGKVENVIVGVGGFLGMGERHVALKMSELQMRRDNNNAIVISTAMTKAQLEQMPAWEDPTAPAARAPAQPKNPTQ